MRIISGTARGTKLYTLDGLATRPTLDRVKESLFNIIQNDIQNSIFLDLFSGSGAIGLEFASRGAKKVYLCDNSKDAITHIKVLERYKDSTLIECILETGRTHQIRCHMEYINHPVVNDPVYGYNKLDDNEFGQMLHAKEIRFVHPITHEYMDFTVDAPSKFYEILEKYKNR